MGGIGGESRLTGGLTALIEGFFLLIWGVGGRVRAVRRSLLMGGFLREI